MKLLNDFDKILGAVIMGGIGSGNWYRWSKKPTEDDFLRLPVQSLKKFACIKKGLWISGTWTWSSSGEIRSRISYEINTMHEDSWMRVYYTNKRTGKDYDYRIRLTTTNPRYGGVRWWFICPAQGCGKRIGVLYLSSIFACRHCYNMTYSSQNENSAFRLSSKARAIHQKLGGSGCLMDGTPEKPKGMHWKTYNQMVESMNAIDNASWIEAGRRFGILP